MITRILIVWFNETSPKNRVYFTYTDEQEAELKAKIAEVKTLKDFVGYHVYAASLIDFYING